MNLETYKLCISIFNRGSEGILRNKPWCSFVSKQFSHKLYPIWGGLGVKIDEQIRVDNEFKKQYDINIVNRRI